MKIIDILQNPSYTSKNVVEKLICYRLGVTKETLFTDSDREIGSSDYERIDSSYHEYHDQKKPLEYILWFVEFLGVRFHVNSATLIPRPETEYMIEAVGEMLQERSEKTPNDTSDNASTASAKATIIDVGTWCGVLWISTLLHNPDKVQEVFLSEYSADALEVAKKNYETLSTKYPRLVETPLSFLECNLVDHPALMAVLQSDQPIVLVANLPYIPDQTFDENVEDNVKKREPRMAFVWGDDGLDLYRRMFDQILEAQAIKSIGATLLTGGNLSEGLSVLDVGSLTGMISTSGAGITMFLEMMTRQVDILRKEYWKILTFEEVKTFHFNIRIVKATRQKSL